MTREFAPVVMVEETLRAYRIPFYARLSEALGEEGRRLVVAYSPEASQAVARGDAVLADMPWAWPTPFRHVGRLAGREIAHQSIREILSQVDDPLVIVNQAVSKVENYQLLYQHFRGRIGLATWGHGRTYSVPTSAAVEHVKMQMTNRSDWFFAYTAGGARHVSHHGFPSSRISIVRNTIDTDALRADLASVPVWEVATFQERHGLAPGRTGLYLGGVDERKGIHFLVEAARLVQRRIPDFILLVGGTGALLSDVERAQRAGGPLRALSRLDGREKALALLASDVLLVPEWVGLVAVDSLVASRPIVTTEHHSHSCELEYLTQDETCVITPHNVTRYASEVAALLENEERRALMADAGQRASMTFSLDAMVDAFRTGINAWDEVRSCGLTGRAKRPHGTRSVQAGRIPTTDQGASKSVQLVVLMTCHNRVERTLACLRSLENQTTNDVRIKVVLVDDGSTDGTAQRVAQEFPDSEIVTGLGDLHWAGGMAVAERVAVSRDYDFLLWLNDDVCLNEHALANLLAEAARIPGSIIVGAVVDPETDRPSYGALKRMGGHPMRFTLVPPGTADRVAAFNGNVVLIPRSARKSIGPIDGVFAHAYADLDYGLRARRAGVSLTQSSDFVASCVRNHGPAMPPRMIDRWRLSQVPTYQPWRSQVRYLRRHGGILWPAYLAVGYARMLLGLRQ